MAGTLFLGQKPVQLGFCFKLNLKPNGVSDSVIFAPAGASENSPAFQRWDANRI
jgi:hypothetical protein